jgi:hypothetical protein
MIPSCLLELSVGKGFGGACILPVFIRRPKKPAKMGWRSVVDPAYRIAYPTLLAWFD